MNPPDLELHTLLLRIADRDSEAMTCFCEATRTALTAFIRRYLRNPWDADEILQDVYCRVWTGVATFDAGRGSVWAWLYMLARSRAIDAARRSRRAEMFVPPPASLSVSGNEEHRQIIRFEVGLVRQALARLPEQYRELVHLSFTEGFSHSEIAERSGIPLGTVKGRLRAAILKLRHTLDTHEPLPIHPDNSGDRAA